MRADCAGSQRPSRKTWLGFAPGSGKASAGPQRIFGLVGKGRIALGYDADFTIVDLKKRWTVGTDWLASRCEWSPFTDMELTGKAIDTIIRGHRVMWDDTLANAAIGEPVRFEATQFP